MWYEFSFLEGMEKMSYDGVSNFQRLKVELHTIPDNKHPYSFAELIQDSQTTNHRTRGGELGEIAKLDDDINSYDIFSSILPWASSVDLAKFTKAITHGFTDVVSSVVDPMLSVLKDISDTTLHVGTMLNDVYDLIFSTVQTELGVFLEKFGSTLKSLLLDADKAEDIVKALFVVQDFIQIKRTWEAT